MESLRALPERLWAPPGRAGDAPRRSWVPPGCPGELREVPGAIWDRFWVPRGASRDRFGVDSGGDFEDSRRCVSTRFAKGRPRVRIALCERIEVRPLRARLENQPKITPRGLPERAVRRRVAFFAPGGDSASISVVSKRLRALPGTLFASPGRPWGAFGRSRPPPTGPSSDPGSTRGASTGLFDRPSRPNIARKGRSTDQSRPKIARRGLRETIRDDVRAIWGRSGW